MGYIHTAAQSKSRIKSKSKNSSFGGNVFMLLLCSVRAILQTSQSVF